MIFNKTAIATCEEIGKKQRRRVLGIFTDVSLLMLTYQDKLQTRLTQGELYQNLENVYRILGNGESPHEIKKKTGDVFRNIMKDMPNEITSKVTDPDPDFLQEGEPLIKQSSEEPYIQTLKPQKVMGRDTLIWMKSMSYKHSFYEPNDIYLTEETERYTRFFLAGLKKILEFLDEHENLNEKQRIHVKEFLTNIKFFYC